MWSENGATDLDPTLEKLSGQYKVKNRLTS